MARVSSTISRYEQLFVKISLIWYFIACRFRWCEPSPFRHESSHNQLHSVHYWLYGIRYVLKERLFETTIRSLLLGAHDSANDCSIKVSPVLCPSNNHMLNKVEVILSWIISLKVSSGSGCQPRSLFATTALLISGVWPSAVRLLSSFRPRRRLKALSVPLSVL